MTTWDGLTFERLNAKRKSTNEATFSRYPQDFALGVVPAGWARREGDGKNAGDYDAAFIFYWIAFNAAYAEGGRRCS